LFTPMCLCHKEV